MPPLTYIANPYSMHVPLWLEAAARCGLEVRIETAECEGAGPPAAVPVNYLTPRWVKGPAILRYLWAGVAARLRNRPTDELLHAHCSSGNGMVAWMSRHPYIVTTYGSEVLAANERGRLYRWLLGRVLQGAEAITATSPQMVEVLTERFDIPPERIHFFDLGLDTHTFCPASDEARRQLRAEVDIDTDETVWVALKRAVPMNRTLEMVQAFLDYAGTASEGKLVVLCGHADAGYVRQIRRLTASKAAGARVLLIDDWLNAADVAAWLQRADFALSVPTWDQMSNAVLEAMACGAIPILADIGGYRSLKDRGADVRWLPDVGVESLQEVFTETAALPREQRRLKSTSGVEFIRRHYADRRVWELLQRLYNLPATESGAVDRAA
jgi:glycosyltransferase involved in cell wall biosynthesis